MISVDQALSEVLSRRQAVGSELVALRDALGRTTSSDVASPVDLPLFDNSAMDGYAVGAFDRDRWEVVGEVRAGAVWPGRLGPGEAVRIFTGAKLPDGTSAVLMQENAEADADGLRARLPIEEGAHVRYQGEELKAGSVLVPKGTRLTPPARATLASVGLTTVEVQARHEVMVVCTGDEVVVPGERLDEGKVYDSNGTAVTSTLQSLGFKADVRRMADDESWLAVAFRVAAEKHGVLVTTGGVSVGDYDHVVPAAVAAGFDLVFHGVAMKPGKPIAFGTHPSGCAWFGLPGNPMSAMVGLLLFVAPYLGVPLRRLHLPLGEPIAHRGEREEYLPGHVTEGGMVAASPTVGSHAQKGLVGADLLARLPIGASLGTGDLVEVLLLPWRSL